jgi:hypothetical protein
MLLVVCRCVLFLLGQNHREGFHKIEVKVPDNVGPGNPSALVANGIRISVKCPHDALPGKKLDFMYSQSRNVSIHCLHHIRTM